jgi:hypothetical protein
MPILSEQFFQDVNIEWFFDEIYGYFDDSDEHMISIQYNANTGTFDNEIVLGENEQELSFEQQENVIKQVENIQSYQRDEALHIDYVADLWNNR